MVKLYTQLIGRGIINNLICTIVMQRIYKCTFFIWTLWLKMLRISRGLASKVSATAFQIKMQLMR